MEELAAVDDDGLAGDERDAGPQRYVTAPTTSSGSWSRWMVRAETETSRSFSITSGCCFTPPTS